MTLDPRDSQSQETSPPGGFLLRLLLRIPACRRLADENRSLQESLADARDRVVRLREEIAARDQRLEGLSSLAAEQRAKQLYEPPGHYYSPIVDPDDDWVRRAMEREAHPDAVPAEFGIDESELLRWFDKIAAHYPANPFPSSPRPAGATITPTPASRSPTPWPSSASCWSSVPVVLLRSGRAIPPVRPSTSTSSISAVRST